MKRRYIFIFIICIIITFANTAQSLAATIYDIDTYYGNGASSPTALLNRGSAPAFASGDTINLSSDLTASTSGIGSLGTFILNITGNNKTIDGANTYEGFSVLSGATYKFNTINLNHFNKSTQGGAIYNAGATTVTGSSFTGNNADDAGGAIYSTPTASLVVGNSNFANNSSIINGGAIYNYDGPLTVYNSTFTGNFTSVTNPDSAEIGGGAIFNVGPNSTPNAVNIYNSTFTGNYASVTAIATDADLTVSGGAMYEYSGDSTITNSTFAQNYAYGSSSGSGGTAWVEGGAIYNWTYSYMNVSDSTFSENYAKAVASDATALGGAISNYYDVDSPSYISNSKFIENYASADGTGTTGVAASYGGAIANYDNGDILLTITNTEFNKNNILASTDEGTTAVAQGGAIFNWQSVMKISDSKFTGNTTTAVSGANATDTEAWGGAIYHNSPMSGGVITGNLDIVNVEFTNNKAICNVVDAGYALGGAIANYYGIITILDSTFTGNSTEMTTTTVGNVMSCGGAIFNDNGTALEITNTTFNDNIATSTDGSGQGGAIWNWGHLYLIANGGITSFTDNKDDTGSNALYINTEPGYITTTDFYAGNGGYILFNDKINSNHSTNIININATNTSNYPTDGNIIFNNTVSNVTINLHNGMLTLGQYNLTLGNYFDNTVLNLSGGILNTANGNIDENMVNSFACTGTPGLFIDANLSSGASDNISVSGTSSGTLMIEGINILSDGTNPLTLFSSTATPYSYPTLDVSNFAAFTDNAKYTFAAASGVLTPTQNTLLGGLNNAVADILDTYRSYSAITDVDVLANLNPMGKASSTLTIFGNKHDINGIADLGVAPSGLSVALGQTLNIFNVGSSTSNGINGFSTGDTGGVINNAGTTSITDSYFKNNSVIGTGDSSALGGVIYNEGVLNLANAGFTENKAISTGVTSADAEGGAIYNENNNLAVLGSTFTGNSISSTTTGDDGWAVAYGGTIFNYAGNLTVSESKFTDNSATAECPSGVDSQVEASGGAIYNQSDGDLTISHSSFTDNKTSSTCDNGDVPTYASGGAIHNQQSGNLIISSGEFLRNSATAIGVAGSSAEGGAIYYIGGSSNNSTISDSTFTDNSASGSATGVTADVDVQVSGGAIYNYGGDLTISNTTFDGNSATAEAATTTGSSDVSAKGGAIYNDGSAILTITNSTFTNNSVNATAGTGGTALAQGGAIYNEGTVSITNGTFTSNSSSDKGGAIYNDGGTLTIKSNGSAVVFSGNSAGTAGNDIYMNGGTLTLNPVAATDSITFADGISSSSTSSNITKQGSGELILSGDNSGFTQTFTQTLGTTSVSNKFFSGANTIEGGILNFNDGASTTSGSSIVLSNSAVLNINTATGNTFNLNSTLTGSGTQVVTKNNGGTVNMNGVISDIIYNQNAGTTNFKNTITNSTINMYAGTFAVSNESNIGSNVNLGIYDGILDTQNGAPGTMTFGNLTFTGISNWLLDVDLANTLADKIISTGTVSGTLNISNINLLSDATSALTSVLVADSSTKGYLTTSVTDVNGALYKYLVSYDGASGALNFTQNGVSPIALTGNVAQSQAFLLQTAIDRQFFANTEGFMSFPLTARESTICCALSNGNTTGAACPISGNGTFSPIYSCDLNRGIWVKSFTSFENIPLQNGPNVSTIEYGTLIGADAPLTYLKRGWVGNTSAYVGYLGSNQNYDGVGVSQNGALVGLAENMIKGNNFLTLMASVGSSMGIANTQLGNDYFNMIYAGAAAKGGHNFEFKDGEYIIQPSLMLAYTYTYTPTYNTASGIEMTSKPLNAIQVVPGIRLIKNLKEEKGQVYLVCNFIYNIMDNSRFSANDVQLPELSVAPYFEYGIGYQRVWKERFTGFFQTLLRGGGKNGVALQFGMRWAI